jgi:predicted CoA-binding protein
MKTKAAAEQFLSQRRIAVTGVSRTPKDHGANVVYRRLRDRRYEVFAVNPHADAVEGDACFPDLRAIPGGVDAVVIGTRPEHALGTVKECIDLNIDKAWMHRGPGAGSVSADATDLGRRHGMVVIDGGCPCMYGPTSDPGHRVMRSALTLSGSVPRAV